MNIRTPLTIATLAAATAVMIAAGPVTPPAGPVAPTMKPLDQVEPRTPVSAVNTPGDASSVYKIVAPGSYYLVGNLSVPAGKSGIVIASPGVTLDLNGFTISGVAGSLNGVGDTNSAVSGISVRNGAITDMGQNGVSLAVGAGVRISNLTLNACGTGLSAGEGAVVDSCTATQTGAGPAFLVSFNAVVSKCTTVNGGGPGFQLYEGSTVKDSSARDHTDGFSLSSKAVAIDCTAAYCADDGFAVGSLCRVERCEAFDCEGDGIHAGARSRVIDCTAALNTGAGVRLDDAVATLAVNSSVTGLFARSNGTGIVCLDTNCTIAANRCVNNGVNYTIVANNYVATIVTAPVSGAINGSSGAAGLGTTDPNANFAN